jgi:hypothetical protein
MISSKRLLCALIFLLLAVAGVATAMWMKARHTSSIAYQSIGILEADLRGGAYIGDVVVPLWQAYASGVVRDLNDEQLWREAMKNPEWKKYRQEPREAYLADWKKRMVVRLVPNSFDITITYTDDSPGGRLVAQLAVKSLIAAYTHHVDVTLKKLAEQYDSQEATKIALDQKMAEAEALLVQLPHIGIQRIELDRLKDQRKQASIKLDELGAELDLARNLKIVDSGSEARPVP